MKSELSNFTTEESEIIQITDGGTPINNGIEKLIQNANPNPLEVEREKISVSDAVNRLERESQELFREKENVAKTTIIPEANNNRTAKVTDKTNEEDAKIAAREKQIFGMKPINFTLLAVGVVVVSYFCYKYYKKNKTLIPLS